jgi:FkbM family methyltransferase
MKRATPVETAGDLAQPQGPIRSLIYDVGLHNGDDSAYYLRSGFHVIAVEANPVFVERARSRFANEIDDGRLTVVEVGIAEGEGEATFWVCEDKSDWSSFDRAIASRKGARHHAISVRLRPFKEILDEHGMPYYCKIDIEGNDHLCVSAMTPQSRPAFISAEVSERALLEQYSSLGYDRFRLVQQQSFGPPNPAVQALKARAPRKLASALERGSGLLRGRLTDRGWYFKRGSSGPLPFRASGPWLTLEEMRRQSAWVEENSVAGDWWDLHATNAADAGNQ